GDVKQLYMDWLRSYRPDLVPLYERLYARGAYAAPEERKRLAALLRRPGMPPPSRFRVRDREEIDAEAQRQPEPPAQRRSAEVQTTLF
ncbi:MAG: hypothetical protein KY433_04050, partial [Actinobacteria bacterium]|nr:hypothetical protein [Actinomycetota bacterium]